MQKWDQLAGMIKPKATTPRVSGDIEWFDYLSCVSSLFVAFLPPMCGRGSQAVLG